MMETDDNICTFRDVKPTPDPIYSYNGSQLEGVPLVIDNGEFTFIIFYKNIYTVCIIIFIYFRLLSV